MTTRMKTFPDMPEVPGVGNAGLGFDLSKFGQEKTPVTAGDLSGGIFGIGSNFLSKQQNDSIDPSALDMWKDRNGLGKMFWNQDGTFDWGAAGTATKALGGLGQLYLGFQANKTANDALDFKKKSYETNLANQISSYNLALTDRATARSVQNETGQAAADKFIDKHKL